MVVAAAVVAAEAAACVCRVLISDEYTKQQLDPHISNHWLLSHRPKPVVALWPKLVADRQTKTEVHSIGLVLQCPDFKTGSALSKPKTGFTVKKEVIRRGDEA